MFDGWLDKHVLSCLFASVHEMVSLQTCCTHYGVLSKSGSGVMYKQAPGSGHVAVAYLEGDGAECTWWAGALGEIRDASGSG